MAELNITSTAVEKGLDLIKGFVEKLAGGAIEEAGLMLADKVKIRRLKNQIKILEKAKKIAEEANISIKQIDLKVLVPLLDYTSLEEDETLQDMWAKLISNYADTNKELTSSIYPFILSQLSSKEAKELEYSVFKVYLQDSVHRFNLSRAELNNLERLGLITSIPKASIKNESKLRGGGQIIKFENSDLYRVTVLGREFVGNCSNKKWPN